MNVSIEKGSKPVFPEWLMKLSLCEVKKRLYEGTLTDSLQHDLVDCDDHIVAIEYKREVHNRILGFSILILIFEFKAKAARRTYKKEVVFRYGYGEDAESGSEARCWYYPNDPAILHLPDFVSSTAFIQEMDWDKPFHDLLPGDGKILTRRLQYNPNRRVTFLVSTPQTGKMFILKMVKPGDFDEFFSKAQAIHSSPLASSIILPRLVSYSSRESAFLYEYIPGIQIKKLEKCKRSELKSFLFREVVKILKEVHQTLLPAIPPWNPEISEIVRMYNLLGGLKLYHHSIKRQIEAVIQPVVDRIAEFLSRQDHTYSHLIHNSFSESHIIYQSDNSNSYMRARLDVIDWDSVVLGPREKDVGSFLLRFANKKEDCRFFINLYENQTGFDLNRELLNCFLQYRIVSQFLRRGLKYNQLDENYFSLFGRLRDI
jgi:hypothetical protein